MRHVLPLVTLLAGLLTAASCTTSIDVGSDGQAGGLSTTGSGATRASSGSAGGSGGGGGATVGVHWGVVSVIAGVTSAPNQDSEVAATFWSGPDGTNGVTTTSQIGPCTITVYTTPQVYAGRAFPSAGTITISGLDEPVSMAPTGSGPGLYAPIASHTNSLFSAGESVTISATGAVVPAFTANLVAPSLIDLQSPAVTNDTGLTLDRSADLTVVWSGGGFGTVAVDFVDSAHTSVGCTFPSSDGTGTIPKAALAALVPEGVGALQIDVQSTQTLMIDGWTILVYVQSSVPVNGVGLNLTTSYKASN